MKKNAIAKCLATVVLKAVGEGGEDAAIPLFLASPARRNQFLVSVILQHCAYLYRLATILMCFIMYSPFVISFCRKLL